MRIKIHHSTRYQYESPVHYSLQELRLTPPNVKGQKIERWQVNSPGNVLDSADPFDNKCKTFVIDFPFESIHIMASGEVVTSEAFEFKDPKDSLSPYYLLQPTLLTTISDRQLELFASYPLTQGDVVTNLIDLAQSVIHQLPYQKGATDVTTTAATALDVGCGVCQDHAHVMLAVCRAKGIPARYVSGYFFDENAPNLASHAWIDACIDIEHSKWVSIDVTHAQLSDEKHIRLALGRDYYSAAPIKGVRSGGGNEELTVDVKIERIS